MPETKQELKRRLGLANKEISQLRSKLTQATIQPSSVLRQEEQCQGKLQDKTNNKNGQSGFVKTIGAFIVWASGIGIGSLSNFLSSSPNILYFSSATFILWLFWLVRGWGKAWITIIIIAGLCLLCGVHKYVGHLSKESELLAEQTSKLQSSITNLPNVVRKAEDEKYNDLLVSANEPTPTLPPDLAGMPTNLPVLFLGNSIDVSVWFPHIVIALPNGRPLLTITKGTNGIALSGEFWGNNGNIVCILETNRFKANPNNLFSIERPDKSTLRIVDQQNLEALNVRVINDKAIRLNCRLRFPGYGVIIISPNEGPFSTENKFIAVKTDIVL